MLFGELLETLGYQGSPHFRNRESELQPETAHLFRAAFDANVRGIYAFDSSPDGKTLPERPAVFVAEASTEEEARDIHRRLWNLSYAPFIVVKLPRQIRIYTGFEYSQTDPTEGQLTSPLDLNEISQLFDILSADAIDSGRIWDTSLAQSIDANQRVDRKLLKNLKQLGRVLKDKGLSDEIAHALIGKYVYFKYLRDRKILTDAWLFDQGIDPEHIFSLYASVNGLQKLTNALENRFNGRIFPINFHEAEGKTLKDEHVSWVASIFSGSEFADTAPQVIQQLHLPFQAYDFRYIPVETFSAIYEQFIDDRKDKGAIYTPEYLADYLLSEIEWAKPLNMSGKILDPACGSGVFLVLAYRRLLEKETARLGRRLTPKELKGILETSIFGVERERDACYVTEFSLILTLLHYVEPRELEKIEFKFPALHNRNIFYSDFFDLKGEASGEGFWQQGLKFDWVVGNPPWASKLDAERNEFALQWIKNADYPVSGQRIAEAFSWLVTETLAEEGLVGLLMPATSLFNLNSKKYRESFFTQHDVLRITNFANLRDILFGKGKGDVLPAATIIYRQTVDKFAKPNIIHYGPFTVNQVANTKQGMWTITINENEICALSPFAAESGETSFWKYALWGNHIDKDAVERIESIFPVKLSKLCEENHWHFQQGSELRKKGKKNTTKVNYISWLEGKKRFNTRAVKSSLLRFSVEPKVLETIPKEFSYIRKQGGQKGLKTTWAPHIIISPVWNHYIIYSEKDFVIPPRQIGIAASKEAKQNSNNSLRAIALLLSSSLAAYYLFFHAQQWGVFRRARLVSTTEVGNIRLPEMSSAQVLALSDFHKQLVEIEKEKVAEIIANLKQLQQKELSINQFSSVSTTSSYGNLEDLTSAERKKLNAEISSLRSSLQKDIDEKIFELFAIPDDIQTLVTEFTEVRLALDKASTKQSAVRKPYQHELLAYGQILQSALDEYAMGTANHQVSINYSDELIECVIEIRHDDGPSQIDLGDIRRSNLTKTSLLSQLSKNLRQQVSQWIYVQRGLRLFDGPRIHIYKSPRLIDWTKTQAMNDVGDIIGEIIAQSQNYEADYA